MRILLLGANGFIGARIGAHLIGQGHQVTAGVRQARTFTHSGYVQVLDCDFSRLIDKASWQDLVRDQDAVINCVGILRETGRSSFNQVHIEAPTALFSACEAAGVRRLIQVSALGDPVDTRFISTRYQGDACLQASDLGWTIIRPSVVFSPAASYGGTSLLRAMSALPVLLLPGTGEQRLQPVDLDDLVDAVARLLDSDSGICEVIEAVGPQAVSIKDYLTAHRNWLGLPPAPAWRTPMWLTSLAAHLGEWLGSGPLGLTMLNMLSRGNIGGPDSATRFAGILGRESRSLAVALSRHPASQADLWHARLYLLGPALRIALGILWVVSGVAGLLTPTNVSALLLDEAGLAGIGGQWLIPLLSVLDILLGIAFMAGWQVRKAGWLMLAMLLGYTAFIGLLLPRYWLEPMGALIKNIPLIPAILVVMALDRKR